MKNHKKLLLSAAAVLLIAFGGTSALAAETITLPAKSVYVMTCTDDTTPVLEMSESKSVSVTSLNQISSLRIFKCEKDGKNPECIYENDSETRSSFKINVKRGEYYYFKIKCSDSGEYEKLIIK